MKQFFGDGKAFENASSAIYPDNNDILFLINVYRIFVRRCAMMSETELMK